ncbi:MAG: TonB-dependent receptor plug domain-containing protein [Bacteroidales bacterium]|nr:TonB-dependent receptor plug domain-containing protein [Bacteroidales bacterium]
MEQPPWCSIDQQAVSHVEIIKGPASLQYGSDAIGGVINLLPHHVPIASGTTGEISFTGKSNTQWLGSSANLTIRKGDFYSNLAVTHNNFGDLTIPYTDYFWAATQNTDTTSSHKTKLGDQLHNTAGRENAVSISTGVVKPWGNSYLEFSYYGTKTGFLIGRACQTIQ